MAVTFDLSDIGQPKDLTSVTRRYYPKYTGPASYATGGDTGIAAAVGCGKVFAVHGLTISNGTATLIGWYNATTDAILWFDMAGAQVANTTNLSTYIGRLEVVAQ